MKNLYLLHVWGDVQPILKGPYKSEKARNYAAKFVDHAQPDLKDGVFLLDIVNGKLTVSSYEGGE